MPQRRLDLPAVPRGREIFCNRTLNLRAIKAIGYDMDYTLIHYNVDAWERQAYAHLKQKLHEAGWPVADLEFQPDFAMRGLVIDTELGNLVKPDRFGYVRQACHGTRRIGFDEQRRTYSRQLVYLSDPRWIFLNTFFSLSEACMYAQLVDRLDTQRFGGIADYANLWYRTHQSLDEAHAEGELKAEIMAAPDKYVDPDPDTALALLDQKEAGKRLLLVTNSDWSYTRAMMGDAFDRRLPGNMTWRDLFDLVVVSAGKPDFFSSESPAFEVPDGNGGLRPVQGRVQLRGVYVNGHAGLVESCLGVSGAEILYVGDHLYTDVRVTKDILRWRTALLVRELEEELAQAAAAGTDQARLDQLMADKAALEFEQAQLRLAMQRRLRGYGPRPDATGEELESHLAARRQRLERLDREIAPLVGSVNRVFNPVWGPLMRTGGEKSHLAWQVERFADIYTSRVANFLYQTPFAYLRAPRGTLPHDLAE